MAMDASSFNFKALVKDPSECSKLSMQQKRELVYELSSWSDGATEMLHSWSRQEILQILCAELGKERKYTGLTKSKMIEQLLKIVCEKRSQEPSNASEVQTTSEIGERTPKRQRKSDFSNCPPIATDAAANSAGDADTGKTVCCKNSACKAKLNRSDVFCKRCSCCICRQYDDNKDPSLWLICSLDSPFRGVSCGMSCHLECSLRHENSGLSTDRQDKGLDGSFCCISCGKVNDLLGSWRKQLVVARDTRRVDILCYRLSLAQKILAGTKHYQNLCGLVDEAVEKLEEEVGTLTGLPVKKARGIVNRLSSGPEIQKLCASAVETLDLILSKRVSLPPPDCDVLASKLAKFEDIQASSVTVVLNSENLNVEGYILWHRRANNTHYPEEPTCRLFAPNTKFLLSGLIPATGYFLKVVTLNRDRDTGLCEFQFRTGDPENESNNLNLKTMEVERSHSPATNCSSLSNPSSVEDETYNGKLYSNKTNTANIDGTNRQKDSNEDIVSLLDEEHGMGKMASEPRTNRLNFRNRESLKGRMFEENSTDNGPNTPLTGLECVPYVDSSEAGFEITPCKTECVKEVKTRCKISGKRADVLSKGTEEPQAGSSSKKRSKEQQDEEQTDKDFAYYVKVIRWLECDGHIEMGFRQKFLTWYSLRARPQEERIVKAFVDTFIEDPESLAAQLVDTFSDLVSHKRCSTVPSGFCMKLWH